MKKYYARNSRGQKCFCKYGINTMCLLKVKFFLPRYKFSIYWPYKRDKVKIYSIGDTKDGKKTIVTFLIHPTAILGKSFNHEEYHSPQDICDCILQNFINLYQYEKE